MKAVVSALTLSFLRQDSMMLAFAVGLMTGLRIQLQNRGWSYKTFATISYLHTRHLLVLLRGNIQ